MPYKRLFLMDTLCVRASAALDKVEGSRGSAARFITRFVRKKEPDRPTVCLAYIIYRLR